MILVINVFLVLEGWNLDDESSYEYKIGQQRRKIIIISQLSALSYIQNYNAFDNIQTYQHYQTDCV
jgi:hypothetical protein